MVFICSRISCYMDTVKYYMGIKAKITARCLYLQSNTWESSFQVRHFPLAMYPKALVLNNWKICLMVGLLPSVLHSPGYRIFSGRIIWQSVNLNRSFVRLTIPTGIKYGGGQRVKTVRLKDNWNNWNKMTGQYTIIRAGIRETFNGAVRTISSGVALRTVNGWWWNLFQSVIQVSKWNTVGPTSYGGNWNARAWCILPGPVCRI